MDVDLHLEHQLCFSLYAASRSVQRAYRDALNDYGLTYPQYLVLLVLWDSGEIGVKELGGKLHLDSGTLSPLLRRMAAQGLLTRERVDPDGRRVVITLTSAGQALKQQAGTIQQCLTRTMPLTVDEAITLRDLALRLVTTDDLEGEQQ